VQRVELSRRYALRSSAALPASEREAFAALVHDRMTEQVYGAPLRSFGTDAAPAAVYTVPVVERGRRALEEVNAVRYGGWGDRLTDERVGLLGRWTDRRGRLNSG
jgi:hypothetical protein